MSGIMPKGLLAQGRIANEMIGRSWIIEDSITVEPYLMKVTGVRIVGSRVIISGSDSEGLNIRTPIAEILSYRVNKMV